MDALSKFTFHRLMPRLSKLFDEHKFSNFDALQNPGFTSFEFDLFHVVGHNSIPNKIAGIY